ncbi:MAG: PocR ligand-binding domain-containing protein [Candidatus Riflebacteria bacterium]|nr:PocR ligand-binding domain-containing protein [Candidatus Riflebacteria bacterium]
MRIPYGEEEALIVKWKKTEYITNTPEELRKLAESLMCEHAEKMHERLASIVNSEANIDNLGLADILDVKAVQSLMNDFFKLTNIGIGIIDIKGNVLIGTGWQDICTKFHRANPDTYANCVESDVKLTQDVELGKIRKYKCKNNLWDISTPIIIEGIHLGNLFLGQFFIRDEVVDQDFFRAQARKYGFDEQEYISALNRVPRWSQETVDAAMSFYSKFAAFISNLGYSNFKLNRALEELRRTASALNQSEMILRIAGGLTRMGGWRVDLPSNEVTWSEEVSKIHGVPFGTKPSLDFCMNQFNTEFREKIREVFNACSRDGVPFDEKMHIVNAKGETLWIRAIGIPERDSSGKVVAVVGGTQDISDQKRSEAALLTSRSYLQAVLDSVNDAVFVCDANTGIIVDVNQRMCEIYRCSHEEAIGTPCEEFSLGEPPYSNHEISEWINKVGKTDIQTFNWLAKRKDGTVFWAEVGIRFAVIGGENRFVIAVRDITERREAEKLLQESEETFRTIYENSSDPILLMDGVYFAACNKATLTLLGIDDINTFLGTTPEDISPAIQPDGRPSIEAARDYIVKARKNGLCKFEWVCKKSDGTVLFLEVSMVPIVSKGKSLIHLTVRDITERKKADIALAEQLNELRRWQAVMISQSDRSQALKREVNDLLARLGEPPRYLSKSDQADGSRIDSQNEHIHGPEYSIIFADSESGRRALLDALEDRQMSEQREHELQTRLIHAQKMESIGRLAGGVAHDFNNMLGVIIGYAELGMAKIQPSDPVFDDLQEITSAAVRSAEITRQLLGFARKQSISPKVLELNSTIDGMLKMMRRIIGEDIDLIWRPANFLWNILMDPSQINQILANMCLNARDAMESCGKIIIETSTRTFDEAYCSDHPDIVAGDYVMLKISDNGCGMNKEVMNKLFEPFFTTKGVGKGTGLGLATVFGIVKQNNGFINVYSELGKGSTFNIYLPRYSSIPESESSENAIHSSSGGGEKILVVEDEPAILNLTRALLEKLGYKVFSASSPNEAFFLSQKLCGKFDLLITDCVMPEMNGKELSRQLKELYPHIKILFMSGYSKELSRKNDLYDEDLEFIQKPFTCAEMASKIRQILGNSQKS